MILETERLYLRELKQEDLDRLHAIFSDEETMRFYPAPFTREQTGRMDQKKSGTIPERRVRTVGGVFERNR